MLSEKNVEKYEVYRAMKANLSKAIKAGFYYEAIFIEYAIMEDRCLSVLKHADIKYLDSRGFELKLSEKIKKMRGNVAFQVPYVRKRITLELLDNMEEWKRSRDRLIHALAKIPYDSKAVEEVAVRGMALVKTLDNKVKSCNNYFNKISSNKIERMVINNE